MKSIALMLAAGLIAGCVHAGELTTGEDGRKYHADGTLYGCKLFDGYSHQLLIPSLAAESANPKYEHPTRVGLPQCDPDCGQWDDREDQTNACRDDLIPLR